MEQLLNSNEKPESSKIIDEQLNVGVLESELVEKEFKETVMRIAPDRLN